jgi:hypothetical protein
VIPKEHAVKFHELSDETLADILPFAKKVANALGVTNYNLLQNNGTRQALLKYAERRPHCPSSRGSRPFSCIFPETVELINRLFPSLTRNRALELVGLQRRQIWGI